MNDRRKCSGMTRSCQLYESFSALIIVRFFTSHGEGTHNLLLSTSTPQLIFPLFITDTKVGFLILINTWWPATGIPHYSDSLQRHWKCNLYYTSYRKNDSMLNEFRLYFSIIICIQTFTVGCFGWFLVSYNLKVYNS